MLFKTSFTALVVASLAVFSTYTPQAEAHSWMDCVDWKFNNAKTQDWSDKGGKCQGYARRFPLGKKFASLDSASPNRHYRQPKKNPNSYPCSDRKHGEERGSDETRASPVEKAYGGKYGRMTTTTVGDTLCVRWPAKNHATKDEENHPVFINLSKVRDGKDISQKELTANNIAKLNYKNCNSKFPNQDQRACGGCFKVPVRASGVYLLQWRWLLNANVNEWYTSCADVRIGPKSKK
ncbi:hypothetical protein BGZ54_008829 [Gamsiella multidivaricata]|nr:hypothetical protein BGZ54_008829 [Gamsiella multidivaricata]